MLFLRGILVLALIPFLTLLTSISALIGRGVFGVSAAGVQFLPRLWGKIIVNLTGVRVQVEGVEKLDPAGPYIFAGNHQSQFDIFALQGYLNYNFRWLAKKELFAIPIFGQAMRLAGYIPVDRTHGREALKSLDEAARRIADGTSVIIFPEGTRSKDGALQTFKSGGMVLAIKSGVPVVPMAIIGTYHILPKGKLLARPGHIWIKVGDPILTRQYTIRQKQELATLLHDKVAALLEG